MTRYSMYKFSLYQNESTSRRFTSRIHSEELQALHDGFLNGRDFIRSLLQKYTKIDAENVFVTSYSALIFLLWLLSFSFRFVNQCVIHQILYCRLHIDIVHILWDRSKISNCESKSYYKYVTYPCDKLIWCPNDYLHKCQVSYAYFVFRYNTNERLCDTEKSKFRLPSRFEKAELSVW